MSFKGKNKETAQKTFEDGLLYCLYRIAEDLGYADKRLTATDTQKKNVIMDMINSKVITVPFWGEDYEIEHPTFDDISDFIYNNYMDYVDDGIATPEFNLTVKYGRRTEVIKVVSPSYIDNPDDPEQCYAFAYMPATGFDIKRQDPHGNNMVPLYNISRKLATGSLSRDVKYNSEEIDKETYSYVLKSLKKVFRDLGKANQGITNDSKEFQELYSSIQLFAEKVNDMRENNEYSVATLKVHLDKVDKMNGKSLMNYLDSYVAAKGRESGNLSSKQISRLNACGRMRALYEKIEDLAWQEKHYYPIENDINKLGETIRDQEAALKKATKVLPEYQKDLDDLKNNEKKITNPKKKEEKIAEINGNIAKYQKIVDEVPTEKPKNLAALDKKNKELETLMAANPKHKLYHVFLDSDRYKEAIASKLLTAKLQAMDSAAMKKALTDRTIYDDLFAKVKESPEFREITAAKTSDEIKELSGKSPSDILKEFKPKKIGLTVDDSNFRKNMLEANRKFINDIDPQVQAITEFLLERSSELLKELKEADSTFHSSSHKQFEASLENLHKKILRLGNTADGLKNLDYDKLKDAMVETAFAAQSYQCLHQGKNLSNGGLNSNIIKRMAVASEIGMIYDYISAPNNPDKTFKGLMSELCAFKLAKDTLSDWIDQPNFKADMAAYTKTKENVGKAKTADTFAADLTDHKKFRDTEVQAVQNAKYYKDNLDGKKANELRAFFTGQPVALTNLKLKEPQADNTKALV